LKRTKLGSGLLLTEVSTDSPSTFEQEFFSGFRYKKTNINSNYLFFVIHNLSVAYPVIRTCTNAKSHPLPNGFISNPLADLTTPHQIPKISSVAGHSLCHHSPPKARCRSLQVISHIKLQENDPFAPT